MGRPFDKKFEVKTANSTAGKALVVDRVVSKTLQFVGITSGTYDVEGVVGSANGSFLKLGTTVSADGMVNVAESVHRLRIKTGTGQTPAPTVYIGGIEQRTDGA